MGDVLDISEVAKGIFAVAKEILQHEGSLPPVRLVLNASGQLKNVQDDRPRTQRAPAVAFFTVCETTYHAFEPLRLPQGEPGTMPEGWINDSQPHDCLDIRIEVPGQEPTCIVVPFRRWPDGTFEFGEQCEGRVDFDSPSPPSGRGNEGLEN